MFALLNGGIGGMRTNEPVERTQFGVQLTGKLDCEVNEKRLAMRTFAEKPKATQQTTLANRGHENGSGGRGVLLSLPGVKQLVKHAYSPALISVPHTCGSAASWRQRSNYPV